MGSVLELLKGDKDSKMKHSNYEIILGGAATGKTMLLKEIVEEFKENGGENVLFVCPTGTIRYLRLENSFHIITPDHMEISDCKDKTAVEISQMSAQSQREIALFIIDYCNYSMCECEKTTLIIVDEAPNILGTAMINLLVDCPICNQIIFTMQSPLQLEQLEEMSGLSLDRKFSTFPRWNINKISNEQYAYFKRQNKTGWKMKFQECFPLPVEVQKKKKL